MTLNKISKSVAGTVFFRHNLLHYNLSRQCDQDGAGARHHVSYMQNMDLFYLVPSTPRHFRPTEARVPH